MTEPDGILLDRWESTGDSQAFMEIVARYQGMVFGVCLRILKDHTKAEDMVQECFLKLTKSRPKSRHALGPWLHRVATNASISQLRSDSSRRVRETSYMDQTKTVTEAKWDDINDLLDSALDSLPEENRAVIVAHYIEGRTQVDVAKHLDIPRSTVTSRLRVGLDRLHQKMKAKGVVLPAAALGTMMISEITHAAPISLTTSMGKAVLRGDFAPPLSLSTGIWLKGVAMVSVVILAYMGYLLIPASEQAAPVIQTVSSIPTVNVVDNSSATEVVTPPLKVASSTPVPIEELPAPVKTIRLRCVDEKGNPVTHALVYVQQYMYIEGGPSIIIWGPEKRFIQKIDGPIFSDDEGYVEFTVFESEQDTSLPRVYAVVPNELVGIWRSYIGFDNPNFKRDDILHMVKSRSISGQVIIPEGYDMHSIQVEVTGLKIHTPGMFMGTSISSHELEEGSAFLEVFKVPVDREGRFEVPNIPADGSIGVRGHGKGLGQWKFRSAETSQLDWIDLPLLAEGIIKGTVRYADTGAPAPNRQVYYDSRDNQVGNKPAGFTNELGEYSIEGLPAGKYELIVGLGDYPPDLVSRGRKDVEVEAGHITDGIDFQLETGKVIHGTVTNKETGKAIHNVAIGAISPDNNRGHLINSTRTDEQGKYSIRLLEGKNRLYIASAPYEIQQPGNLEDTHVMVSKSDDEHEPVDIQLPTNKNPYKEVAKVTIQGQVFDQQKNPLEGVIITDKYKWEMDNGKSWSYWQIPLGRSDKNGRFSFEITSGKAHEIIIGGKGWSSHNHDSINLKEGESHIFDPVYLWRQDAAMAVQVLDVEGKAISNAVVNINAPNFYEKAYRHKTDQQGMVYLKNLPDTEFTLSVTHFEYTKVTRKGMAEDQLDVTMEIREK